MEKKIRILVADDHPIFRTGLRQVLERNFKYTIVHESADGEDALRFFTENDVDIAVLDIQMPGMNGLDLARTVRKRNLPLRIIILTMHKQEDMVDEAFNLGVYGYVLKENAVLDILHAVDAVSQGEYFISPQVSSHIIKQARKMQAREADLPLSKELTETERKILKLISQNKTSKEIADELFISSRTVDNHRTNICSKLNLHGPHKLLLFALENKDKL